ncbi:MAG TPA: phage tail protein [Myxococcaceae bacterium]|jgi:microcystin-dependent protein
MEQQKSRKWLWVAAILACAGAQGPKGDSGEAGPAGQNALVSVAPEPAGAQCSGAGIAVKSGLDANGNGTLDAAEVTQTNYVCNGALDTPAQVLAKIVTVDGNGSGLDADLLQGQPLNLVAPPTGTVVAFAGTTVPAGWLLCNGQQVSRTTFAALFTAIGIVHGPGDGINTFTVPDYRGRFLRGVDGTANRDPDKNTRTVPIAGASGVGNAVGSVQLPATARPTTTAFNTDLQGAHTHANGNFDRLLRASAGSTTTDGSDTSPSEPDILSSAQMQIAGAHTHSITGGGDNETRPNNAYVNFIIKT